MAQLSSDPQLRNRFTSLCESSQIPRRVNSNEWSTEA